MNTEKNMFSSTRDSDTMNEELMSPQIEGKKPLLTRAIGEVPLRLGLIRQMRYS